MKLSRCPGCRGKMYITLATMPEVVSRYRTLDDEGQDEGKNFPCPMCQPVFYLSDLEQVNAGERVPSPYMKDEAFITNLWRRMASRLGALAARHCLETRTNVDPYDPHNLTEVGARMFVVKKDAKGWLNWRNQ